MAVRTLTYGEHSSQYVEAWMPVGRARAPVVLLHGGWWRDRFDLHLMDGLAEDLAGRGHPVWNVEFRRLGGGGGWPATHEDVLAALDTLSAEGVDLGATVVVGHSAGGHLGLLAAGRRPVAGVVAQAPVTDLVDCARRGLGEGATPLFLDGAPAERVTAYRHASPREILPLTARVLVVHGSADERVPVSHSRTHVAWLQDRDVDATLWELEGEDHFFVLRPEHPSWQHVIAWVDETSRARRVQGNSG